MKRKDRIYTEEQKEIAKFVKILLGLVVIIGALYLFTVFVVNKEDSYKRTNTDGEIKYDNIVLGTLLNRADDEYYVLVLDTMQMSNDVYLNLSNQYKSGVKHLPIYIADLSNELNKSFIGDVSNYSTDSIDNLKIKGTTLIKVKNHKIVKFIENNDDIIEELK